jgi:hypothetical protein
MLDDRPRYHVSNTAGETFLWLTRKSDITTEKLEARGKCRGSAAAQERTQ